LRRCDAPASILAVPEQRGEARVGVKTRPTEPVDGAVLGDERGRLAIPDESVVLDAGAHEHDLAGTGGENGACAALTATQPRPAGRGSPPAGSNRATFQSSFTLAALITLYQRSISSRI
jgi:hypothetical protein